MQSVEDFEPTGAFEAIKVLGRELQHSKERIKNLENGILESRGPSSSVDPDAAKALVRRAEKAEALVSQLKEELAASENTQAKLNLKIEKLQTRIDKPKAVKQEQQDLVILSNNERAPTNCVVELETKLKNEAKEKQEALAKSDSLKKEVSRLDALLRKEAADSRARINEFREVEERNGVWAIEQYFVLAEDYPKHQNRPDYLSLQPVCLASMDLGTYLEADQTLKWVAQSMICLPNPERLLWASTACQIGLAFGPLYRYTGARRGWVKDSHFTRQYGKEVELFFTNGDRVYYAGRYKCHDIRARNPQGCFRRDAESAEALADVTFDSHTRSRNDGMWQMVSALYRDGVLKAECAILHCVGFNHKVHDILASRYEILNGLERRRKQEREMPEPPRAPKKNRGH